MAVNYGLRPAPAAPANEDAAQSRFNIEVADGLRSLLVAPLLQGRLVEVPAASGAQTVLHGLGRVPAGWVLVAKDEQADLWNASDPVKASLSLQSDSATATFTIWVF